MKFSAACTRRNFVSLMGFEAKRAQELYAKAQSALAPEDRATLLTAEAMRLIYAALLERIIKSNYRVLRPPPQPVRAAQALPGRPRVGGGPLRRAARISGMRAAN